MPAQRPSAPVAQASFWAPAPWAARRSTSVSLLMPRAIPRAAVLVQDCAGKKWPKAKTLAKGPGLRSLCACRYCHYRARPFQRLPLQKRRKDEVNIAACCFAAACC